MTIGEIKAAVRQRDGQRCTDCGMTTAEHLERFGTILHVHRMSPGSVYSPEGCVTVCRPCHATKPRSPAGCLRAGHARKMVALTPEHHDLLAQLAGTNRRPLLREFRIALNNHFIANGLKPKGKP